MDKLQRDIHLKMGELSAFNVRLSLNLKDPVARVSERFLSFALDTSQVVAGKWWNPDAKRVEYGSGTLCTALFNFDLPGLDMLVEALSPAYLRIGGSEADKVFYDMDCEGRSVIPTGYHSVLTREQWSAACEFTRRNHLGLIFTLNAGPANRGGKGEWQTDNIESLMTYTIQHGYHVDTWELGNEVNVFFSVHGWRNRVSSHQYAADLKLARQLVDRLMPGSSLATQGSAFWPILGELPLHPFGFLPNTLRLVGNLVDQVVWHYYPQQSRRGPFATRRASPTCLLDPRYLNEVDRWAMEMLNWRDQYAPGKPLWMGETGNAQFGGEPGVSDSYIGGLWWLDQLGMLARSGHQVVVRQTLTGMNYGMLDDDLNPRPDYWNSILWKRLMGQDVYAAEVSGDQKELLRAYAHTTPGRSKPSVTVFVINLDRQRIARVSIPQFSERHYGVYSISAPDVLGGQVFLNGTILQKVSGLPELRADWREPVAIPIIELAPLSYAFVVFP